MLKQTSFRYQCVFYVLLLMAVLFCVLFGTGRREETPVKTTSVLLLEQGGEPFGERDIPLRLYQKSGESRILRGRLPEDLTNTDYLFFYASLQSVQVYLDKTLALDTGDSLAGREQWCHVSLSEEDAGLGFTIHLTKLGNRIPDLFYPVYVGSYAACSEKIWIEQAPSLFMCIAVFLVGLVTLMLGFYGSRTIKLADVLQNVGWLLILTGLWGLTQTRLLSILWPHSTILIELDMLFRMLAPIQLVLAVRALVQEENFRWEVDNFFYIFVLFFVACVAMDWAGVYPLSDTAWWSQVFLLVFGVYLAFFGAVEFNASYKYFGQKRLRSNMILLVLLAAVFYGCFVIWFEGEALFLGHPLRSQIFYGLCCLLCLAVLVFVLSEMRVLLHVQDQLTQSQIKLMLSQINPHFLYNTLNSIRTLIRTDVGAADRLVYHFSKFLRSNIRAINSVTPIPFGEELNLIMAYANIEQTCFKKLEMEYDIQVRNFRVPPLTIQPLVENAIKHGVLQRPEGGKVTLRTYESDTHYCLAILDDGVGFDPAKVLEKADSYGLKNVQMRLEYYCHADISIASQLGAGSAIHVHIPKGRKERWEHEDDLGR